MTNTASGFGRGKATQGQHYCYVCRNEGTVFYYHDILRTMKSISRTQECSYETCLRCSCARGKDVSRWSRHQIIKSLRWTNPATKEDESLYWPDVKDILTAEEIGLIETKNKSRNAAISEGVDVGTVVQDLVRGLAV